MTDDWRGILYPERLPTFHRRPAPGRLAELARWFWIPRWDLPAGHTSRQSVLSFPACNLVVQPAGVTIAGPTTVCSHRDLRGTGWAVGASLRPAGVAVLGLIPAELRDAEVPFDAPDLRHAVTDAMAGSDEAAANDVAARAFGDWLAGLPAPTERGRLANAMEERVAGDRGMTRVAQLAAAMKLSERQLQRLARDHVGLPPLAVIRRYRLQEAAQRLRDHPEVTVAEVAADLGYADQAHLAADFRTVLGLRAGEYRDHAQPGS